MIGTSMVVVFRSGPTCLLVPQDEEELARRGWADEVLTFRPGSLEKITTAGEALRGPLEAVGQRLVSWPSRIGYEHGEATEPASYAAVHLYGLAEQELLQEAFSPEALEDADRVLSELRSMKTPDEIAAIHSACKLAERAFGWGASQVRVGMTELEAADLFRRNLSTALPDFSGIERADGFVWCMSGPNSALASGAYARSRVRKIAAGDLVLIHCNSYADGHWTDITRTYSMGPPSERVHEIREAVFAARDAALVLLCYK